MCTHRGKAVKKNTTYLENFNTINIANNVRMTKIDQDRDLFSPFNATGTSSSVLLCHLDPNDEDLNIWKESEANKLPVGKHEV